ncbi:sulfotransferase [Alteromonas sp. ASW11-36]|uniref:Sulfotransferase n=1 Tax=Alteromonas arenosi TaxID=3055817 RepID=A0ABT7SZX2_9ALTE|nr:tetratricopeptide repeat-containing sulfotransferase family protein [Alteromonas sp. ASW11-36]MDM7861746.1 sulfotransferase [Alteromonas sp. ASW11-36]
MDIRTLLGKAVYALQHGDTHTASSLAAQVLAKLPNEPNSLQILGNVSAQQGLYADALKLYRQGLSANPNHVHLLNFAGLAAKNMDDFEAAQEYFQQAITVDPNYYHAAYNLANLYKSEYHFDEAERLLREVIIAAPQFLTAQTSLADLLEQSHRLAEAESISRRVIATDSNNFLAHLTLANIAVRHKQWAKVKHLLLPLIESGQLSTINFSVAVGLVAQADEKQGEFSTAFARFTQANQALQQIYQHDYQGAESIYAPTQVQSMLRYIEHIEPREEVSGDGQSSLRQPVFLVGFPRSGTTLLDQVLSSHSDICVLEEKENLAFLYQTYDWHSDKLDALFNLTDAQRKDLQQQYWQIIDRQPGVESATIVIDKLPLNLVMLAHIYCVFPHAKVIFALREPRDSVISCFQQRFQMNRAMYEMLTIEGAARYYDLVMRYADTVLSKLPLQVHKIRYEDVVADLDSESKALARFLDIEWQDAMLDYQTTARGRAINTPSAKQVIQPLYTSSQKKYQRYADVIENTNAYAALQRWSDYWGYAR